MTDTDAGRRGPLPAGEFRGVDRASFNDINLNTVAAQIEPARKQATRREAAFRTFPDYVEYEGWFVGLFSMSCPLTESGSDDIGVFTNTSPVSFL
jgi:hypothetical protein